MTKITAQNNIRYTLDTLNPIATGAFVSNASSGVNLARASKVNRISVSGSQPAGTARRFAFRINGAWGKLTTAGNFSAFAQNSSSIENVLANGNIASELTALTSAPALAGRTVGIAIAMSSTDPQNAIPSASLSFACSNDEQQLTTIEYSPVYELGNNAQLVTFEGNKAEAAGGSVNVTARLTDEEGAYSDWVSPSELSGRSAKTLQFRAEYKASEVGRSTAQVKEAAFIYSIGNTLAPDSPGSEIITQCVDWYMPIHSCRLTVNHNHLTHSAIKAFVAFRDQPKAARAETLGVSTGSRKTFQLANTKGIKYDTFKLYFDGVQAFTDYELNCEVGRVTCKAPEGVIISCDYDYNWGLEQWQEMTLTSRWAMDGFDKSEYRLTVPDNNKSAAAVKIQLLTTSGHINDETLGTASGTAKSFKLTHPVNEGKISVSASGQALSSKFWALQEDTRYITVAAPAGQTIKASYDWLSESPIVQQFSAIFSE